MSQSSTSRDNHCYLNEDGELKPTQKGGRNPLHRGIIIVIQTSTQERKDP